MIGLPTRRAILLGSAALPFASREGVEMPSPWRAAADARLVAIERRIGGRLGVAVIDPTGGFILAHRAEERFPMCSTFKVLLVGAVLNRVAEGRERLDRPVSYSEADVLPYAPITKSHVASGMTIGEFCAAAIEWSDNIAANLLLREIGGPAAVTAYARSLGNPITRLDRTEPSLNEATPGDPRDTTSPRAMVEDLRRLLLGSALSADGREHLENWMRNAKTGTKRLRAGLPPSWIVGDKTGTGDHGTANVLAILRPPNRRPLLAAIYMTETTAPTNAVDAAHAEIGRMIAEAF